MKCAQQGCPLPEGGDFAPGDLCPTCNHPLDFSDTLPAIRASVDVDVSQAQLAALVIPSLPADLDSAEQEQRQQLVNALQTAESNRVHARELNAHYEGEVSRLLDLLDRHDMRVTRAPT